MVHETGRRAVSKLCGPPVGSNIFTAVLSNAYINGEISPQRKGNLVLVAEDELLGDLGFGPFARRVSFW